ncbi:DTW domain-containing protein [Oligoflexaceae bacterium]|nr:DTW domain-containing protein [Oligoflexaceae bacterium]
MSLHPDLFINPSSKEEHHRLFTRCSVCRLQQRVCLCSVLHQIPSVNRLQLVIHQKETKRTTNTGLLAAKCLKNSHVNRRGHPEPESLTNNEIDWQDYQPILLFPNEGARVLTREFVQSIGKPVVLVVPDGNWNQASRMPRRVEQLIGLPSVILPEAGPTKYLLRQEKRRPEGLATMEAISRAFSIMGETDVADYLDFVFTTMVQRTLWCKGVISTDDARQWLPLEA